jgi:hypothetical protein
MRRSGRFVHRVENFSRRRRRGWPYDPFQEVTIVTRETIDDRWLTLIIGPDGQGREGTSEVYDRFTAAVAELAIRMVHGLREDDEADDSLIALTFRVEQFVEEAVKDFAVEIETKRLPRTEPRVGMTRAAVS